MKKLSDKPLYFLHPWQPFKANWVSAFASTYAESYRNNAEGVFIPVLHDYSTTNRAICHRPDALTDSLLMDNEINEITDDSNSLKNKGNSTGINQIMDPLSFSAISLTKPAVNARCAEANFEG